MEDEISFSISYELMTKTTENVIKRHLKCAIQSENDNSDMELNRARTAMELWYNLALAGSIPFDVLDRDRLYLVELIYYSHVEIMSVTSRTRP